MTRVAHGMPRIVVVLAILLLSCGRAPSPSAEISEPSQDEIPFDAIRAPLLRFHEAADGALEVRAGAMTVRTAGEALTIAVPRAAEIRLRTEGAGEARLAQDGTLTRVGTNGVVEHVAAIGDVIEQSWRVGELPAQPLSIRVRIEGASFVASDEAGLHFRGADSAFGYRYGHGVLVDSTGRRFDVPSEWTGDAIELRVSRERLRDCVFPVVLDPTISPEIAIDAPLLGEHFGVDTPRILFDGTVWWALYHDFSSEVGDTFLTRVSASGEVLDPYGIPIPDAGTGAEMAASADHVLVVFPSSGLRAVRVRRSDGSVLDPVPLTIATRGSAFLSVGSDGMDFVVSWSDSGGKAARVLADGTVAPITLPSYFVTGGLAPPFSFVRDRFVGVRFTGTTLHAARMARDAATFDAAPVALYTVPAGRSASTLAVGASPTGLVLAWNERDAANVNHIMAARCDDDGALGLGSVTELGSLSGSVPQISAASDGARGVVVWRGQTGTTEHRSFGTSLDPTGAPVDAPFAVGSDPTLSTEDPFVAIGASTSLIVWEELAPLHRVLARRRGDDGSWRDAEAFPLAFSANPEQVPVVAAGGDVHLVAWADARNWADRRTDVYAARVTDDGTVLDATATLIATGALDEAPQAIDFDGSDFFVVWARTTSNGTHDVLATRVGLDGLVRSPEIPLVVDANDASEPAIAFDETQHLLAWNDDGGLAGGNQVLAQRIAIDGTATGPRLTVDATYRNGEPRVASASGTFLVGFATRPVGSATTRIALRRIASDGSFVDATLVPLVGRELEVVGLPSGFVVLTYDLVSGTQSVYSTAVPTAASPTARRLVFSGPLAQWVTATADGAGALGILRADRMLGASIGADGTPDSSGPFEIMATPDPVMYGDAALGANGDVLFAYERVVPGAPFTVDRVRARVISRGLAPLGAPCASGVACGSGFCSDGVCCETACGDSDANDCQVCSVLLGSSANGSCDPRSSGATCRAARGECDDEEVCDGSGLACPADARRGSDHECRVAASICDASESCDGVGDDCPLDLPVADGTSCDDGLSCNGGEVCVAGACSPGVALACDDLDPCTLDECDDAIGCMHSRSGCDDAGTDAGVDAGTDAGVDAGTDAGVDAGTDAGEDAGNDAGQDAGTDGGADAGPPVQQPGCACTVDTRRGDGPAWAWVVVGLWVATRHRARRA